MKVSLEGIRGHRTVKDFGDLIIVSQKNFIHIYDTFNFNYNVDSQNKKRQHKKITTLSRKEAACLVDWIVKKNSFAEGTQERKDIKAKHICNHVFFDDGQLGMSLCRWKENKRQLLIEKFPEDFNRWTNCGNFNLIREKLCWFTKRGEELFVKWFKEGEI